MYHDDRLVCDHVGLLYIILNVLSSIIVSRHGCDIASNSDTCVNMRLTILLVTLSDGVKKVRLI